MSKQAFGACFRARREALLADDEERALAQSWRAQGDEP